MAFASLIQIVKNNFIFLNVVGWIHTYCWDSSFCHIWSCTWTKANSCVLSLWETRWVSGILVLEMQ